MSTFYDASQWASGSSPVRSPLHDPAHDWGDGAGSGSGDRDVGDHRQHDCSSKYQDPSRGTEGSSGWRDWGSDRWQDHSWGKYHWGHASKGDDRNDTWQSWQRKGSQSDTWGTGSTGSTPKEQPPPECPSPKLRAEHVLPEGWQPRPTPETSVSKVESESRGPSEKMVVPSFSGTAEGTNEDIGASARSYVRQVAAWQRMTRLSIDKQALVLYQNLGGKAWVDAERLDVDRLASKESMTYFLGWIRERYLDVQVTQVGRALSDFFRKLKRKPGQSIRDYLSDFDRAHARLTECGCLLPDLAAAWVFVDRMELEEGAELNLLASVGNQYQLRQLQQAAIVQDRGLRKPWETNKNERPQRKEWWGRRTPHSANMADIEESDSEQAGDGETEPDDLVPENVAEELYEAFMTHETAKQKYRDTLRLRGSDPEAMKQVAADRLQAAKARSFCAGCKRRGHWHKDACCPLNQTQRKGQVDGCPTSSSASTGTSTSTTSSSRMGAAASGTPKTNFPCHHVVYVTWDIEKEKAPPLTAITDTACSKTAAGVPWIEKYLSEAKHTGMNPVFLQSKDSFKFGASKVFESSYALLASFVLGNYEIVLKVAVVNGDVPLLMSRSVLGQLGMILDVAANRASFKSVQVENFPLLVTETGHPALPVKPVCNTQATNDVSTWANSEIKISQRSEQYMPGFLFGGCEEDRVCGNQKESIETAVVAELQCPHVSFEGIQNNHEAPAVLQVKVPYNHNSYSTPRRLARLHRTCCWTKSLTLYPSWHGGRKPISRTISG